MSTSIFNIIIIEFRLTETIQISDFSAYRFQQYQQVFQMMENHVDDFENRFFRFVNHVAKNIEIWKNNDRRIMNVWFAEDYFLIDDVLKKVRIIVSKRKWL